MLFPFGASSRFSMAECHSISIANEEPSDSTDSTSSTAHIQVYSTARYVACGKPFSDYKIFVIVHLEVEKEHVKCRMCAQTRPFDKATTFLTQQCPAADQTNWMMRIQQLKNEMDVEQGRVGSIRSLLGLQANTPRPKEKEEDATPRRSIKIGSESRRSRPSVKLMRRRTS